MQCRECLCVTIHNQFCFSSTTDTLHSLFNPTQINQHVSSLPHIVVALCMYTHVHVQCTCIHVHVHCTCMKPNLMHIHLCSCMKKESTYILRALTTNTGNLNDKTRHTSKHHHTCNTYIHNNATNTKINVRDRYPSSLIM